MVNLRDRGELVIGFGALSKKPPMIVPDTVRKCVAFIGTKSSDDKIVPIGTAFFVSLPSRTPDLNHPYIVTAKHIIGSLKSAHHTHIYVRVNLKSSGFRWVETDIDEWESDPDDPVSDVCVSPIKPGPDLDIALFPLQHAATESAIQNLGIGIGDEVFLGGLFTLHSGTQRNIPIIRVGNIAAMPEEPVLTEGWGKQDAYLVECRSLGGISGSPVFVHLGEERISHVGKGVVAKTVRNSEFYLLGLMHGHWNYPTADMPKSKGTDKEKEGVNTGISIVVPFSKIAKALSTPRNLEYQEFIVSEFQSRHKAVMD